MSDLHMYELEDIAWDELDHIDDHIVPHPSNEHENEPAYQEDNYKKFRREVIGVSNDAGHSFSTTYVNQERAGGIPPQKKIRTKSLENDSWSQAVEGVIPDSCDSSSSRETTVLPDTIRVPGQCLNSFDIDTLGVEFHDDDTKAGEKCAVNDTNSCAYSLSDMSQTENDLSFLDNDRENNESADLLYYRWPDIENFEDVDRMLRNCDSTFVFGGSNQDDMAWLSSNIESNFVPFESVPEQGLSKLNNASSSTNDSNVGSSSISYKLGFQGSKSGEAHPLGDMSFMSGSAVSDRKGEFISKDQQKKQAIGPNTSEGKRKDRSKSHQVSAHPNHQKQKKNVAPNSFGYLQTPTPYMHLNYACPSNQISVDSQLAGVKSEMNSFKSVSPRESSYASNQARSMESSYRHPFSAPVMSVDEKLEKLRRRQGFYHYPVPKQFHQSQNEGENRSGVEKNNLTNPADGDSSSVPATSCMSSGFDDISLEASNFRQLQQVVEQLDIRTKSCIRDSLYRLARCAEQRHRYAYMEGDGQRDVEAGDAFIADGSNNGFMDMETDTNPIDRSVAHLLFHQPSNSSTMPAHDGSSLKSYTMIHGSITSTPVLVRQLVCEEEAASEAEKKVPITGDG